MEELNRLARAAETLKPGAFYHRLRREVIALLAEGRPRTRVYSDLEVLRHLLEAEPDMEDTVLEVLDDLDGFCSPHMRI